MTKNALIFKNFCESADINLSFADNDGKTIAQFKQKLKCGVGAEGLVLFNENDTLVSIYMFDYINYNNLGKKEFILDKINELNKAYTYLKFVNNDGAIGISSHMQFDNNFKAEIVADSIVSMLQAADEEYEGFMKIIWR